MIGTLVALTLSGCSAGGADHPTGASIPGPNAGGSSGELFPGRSTAGAAGGENPPPIIDITPITTADAGASCTAVVQAAEKLSGIADIVIAIDNSLSMTEEAAAVQNNLNSFSSQIKATGIDAHVVLISSAPNGSMAGGMSSACVDPTGIACIFVPGLTTNGNGICVAPPLGAQGACPASDDSNQAAGYKHVLQVVDSHNALAQIQGTFSQWQGMIREKSAKTFVVISDDESSVPAGDFTNWVDGQAALKNGGWRFSGIFCTSASQNCSNVGATYQTLVQQTQGVSGNLGDFGTGQVDSQFKAVFDSVANLVVKDARPVDCQWNIPAPPDGQKLDPNAVNVRYTTAGGKQTSIYGVDSQAACTDQFEAWFYDNAAAPTKVVACPKTCQTLQADLDAKIEVLFGCARQKPPIR